MRAINLTDCRLNRIDVLEKTEKQTANRFHFPKLKSLEIDYVIWGAISFQALIGAAPELETLYVGYTGSTNYNLGTLDFSKIKN